MTTTNSGPNRPTPLRYHGPGWRVDLADGGDAILWAPNEKRDHWAASWNNQDGTGGDYKQGETYAQALDALDTFPEPDVATKVREAFARAVSEAGAS